MLLFDEMDSFYNIGLHSFVIGNWEFNNAKVDLSKFIMKLFITSILCLMKERAFLLQIEKKNVFTIKVSCNNLHSITMYRFLANEPGSENQAVGFNDLYKVLVICEKYSFY